MIQTVEAEEDNSNKNKNKNKIYKINSKKYENIM